MATYDVGDASVRAVATLTNGVNSVTIHADRVAIKGVSTTREKVWSTDTGRSTTGMMMGEIVALKRTFKIDLIPITKTEYERIESVVTDTAHPFFTATVNDGVKTYSNYTVYAASTSNSVYNDKVAKYFDYSIELVQK